MEILLDHLGKRYLRRWIFRGVTYEIDQGSRLGITGFNGSGKSTLLKIIMGALNPSEGQVVYRRNGSVLSPDKIFRQFAFAAPYTDLIEEMTLHEFLGFHTKFRPLKAGMDTDDIIELLGSRFKTKTYLRSFSSGMKQRVRLVLAVCTEARIVVLDEPTSNLDEEGKRWYAGLLDRIDHDSTVIVASNEPLDMAHCDQFINIPDHSPSR